MTDQFEEFKADSSCSPYGNFQFFCAEVLHNRTSFAWEKYRSSGGHLVRVRAQVMTRDDSTECWVPLGGGGLSNVSVRKRTPDRNEYLIFGKRISDQTVVLSCTIKKDFEYNIVMPTFHHWKTGEKKFGLTFQTAADARAFDKGVRMVIEDLLDGGANNGFGPEYIPLRKTKITDMGDDDVFMALELPVDRDSTSSSGSSGSHQIHHHFYHHPQSHPFPAPHLHRMYFNSRNCSKDSVIMSGNSLYPKSSKDKLSELISDRDSFKDDEQYSSYVQFARERPHEYSYPIVQPESVTTISTSLTGAASPTSTIASSHQKFSDFRGLSKSSCHPVLKKPVQLDPLSLQPPPLLPTKSSRGSKKKRTCGKKRRCRDCHEVYYEDSNPRGGCPAGPDPVQSIMDGISCMCIAEACNYHCFADSEGNVPPHPCAFTGNSNGFQRTTQDDGCTFRRWLALGLLSIIFPCLCLYLPLAGCHRLGQLCHLCGAKHHPS